jgi:hypothetical protein
MNRKTVKQTMPTSGAGCRGLLFHAVIIGALVSLVGCGTEPVPVRTRANPSLEQEIVTSAGEAPAVATPFDKYDAIFKEKIRKRWFEILSAAPPLGQKPGRVILKFNLRFDGNVTGLEVAVNEVGEQFASICKRAVIESAPFLPWPPEMKRMVGATYREVSSSFDHR